MANRKYIQYINQNKMLTFSTQEKIIGEILKRSSNYNCSDCNTISPTWASLDFGVFVCSNCAGAHRALGPTITRVKSTKLDSWHSDWVANMQIGNKQINQYWQAKLTVVNKKPKMGSSLQQINRYAIDKYIKRKFAAEGNDPLTEYKKNQKQKIKMPKLQQPSKSHPSNKIQEPVIHNVVHNGKQNKHKNFEQNLLVFEVSKSDGHEPITTIDEQQFGSYTGAHDHNLKQQHTKEVTFADLVTQGSHKNHNLDLNNQFNYHNGHHNLNNGNFYQPSQQFHHPIQNNNLHNPQIHNVHNPQFHQFNHINTLPNQQNNMNLNAYGNSHFNNNHQLNNQHNYNRSNYHSLNHSIGVNQNGQYGWQNHHHHYHQQNLAGINGQLPVNAQYPGQFKPISLSINDHKQTHQQQESWVNAWK